MLHHIAPHVFHNTFQPVEIINPNDYVFYFHDNKIMLKKEGDFMTIPQRKDLSEPLDKKNAIFLFSLNSTNCFLINSLNDTSSFVFEDIFVLRNHPLKEISWIGSVAYHLMGWYAGNKFCGKCGSKNVAKKDERALVCENCSTIVYPKISPAVIVAITCNDKILLARGKHYKGNFYSLIAGYVDTGESLEETIVREVREEIGIEIRNIRYYSSQPWPFSGSIMIGYFAEADDTQPIHIDENEIIEAAWFTRGNLPEHATNFSIAGELIELFNNGSSKI
jgi:NAD+ diphosphatase